MKETTGVIQPQSRAFLVGMKLPRHGIEPTMGVEESLGELGLLADTAGLQVVGQTFQTLNRPDPATYIRKGKVEEVRRWVEELEADIVIFDDELSPRHQRELERVFGDKVNVLDRTALILDIFAQHARTREGALQVSLAQYEYRLPRLTRQWTHLARQAGGASARGGIGGVGLRGPGETQLETDRRDIRRHIAHLKRELEEVCAHRERHRRRRYEATIPTIALVGYTNAGKSTLLNTLSGADVSVADQLFVTLDPTTRRVNMPSGRDVLVTDTVGFIQKLPHLVVAAFRATLEEIREADLILHVADVSHPAVEYQIRVVERTLYEDIAVGSVPIVLVLNKIDQLETTQEERLPSVRARYPDSVAISALEGRNLDHLLHAIETTLQRNMIQVAVQFSYADGQAMALFRQIALDVEESYTDYSVQLVGWIPSRFLSTFSPFLLNR